MSYESMAHAEWHINAGVPSGYYGGSCPWDACGHGFADDYYAELQAQEELEAWLPVAPALREGEEWVTFYSPYRSFGPATELDTNPPF